MNLQTAAKRAFSVVAALAFGLLALHGLRPETAEPSALVYTLLALDALLFLLALPVTLAAVPVVGAAWYYLDLDPTGDGLYLLTILLGLLGAMQWFWLARFYFPPEAPFQKLDLTA